MFGAFVFSYKIERKPNNLLNHYGLARNSVTMTPHLIIDSKKEKQWKL